MILCTNHPIVVSAVVSVVVLEVWWLVPSKALELDEVLEAWWVGK